jgi:hypothetical protein
MNSNSLSQSSYTSFDGHRRIAAGAMHVVALAVKHAMENGCAGPVLIFDDGSGRSVDIDTRGTDQEVLARLAADDRFAPPPEQLSSPEDGAAGLSVEEPRGRGRPKLGVIAREVTLLPRHWEWLGAQTGGASVALRKLVEDARKKQGDKDSIRKAQERSYHFMSAMAGDLSGFEEATRALFAHDKARLAELIAVWPADVRDHVMRLAFGDADRNG